MPNTLHAMQKSPVNTLKDYSDHQCHLTRESDSCLPILSPHSSKYKRMVHEWRKFLIVSKSNPRTKMFFRSAAAIMSERKRQIYTVPFYIIHPFSRCNMYLECIMYFLWTYGFFMDPIFVAFYEMKSSTEPIIMFTIIVNVLLIVDIGLCFITGYQIKETKEIVLNPRRIAIHYLRTYFIFDLLGSLPFRVIVTSFSPTMDEVYFHLCSALHLLRIVRIPTVFQCFRQITLKLKINDPAHVCVRMVILTYLFIHWISCIVYMSNNLNLYFKGTLQGTSWLRRLGVSAIQNVRWYRKYLVCLHTVILNFYGVSMGMVLTHEFGEHIILSLVMIFGSIYYVYALITTLQLVKSATTSESKYEEFLFQLKDYMRAKMLPADLKHKIIIYYEHRFQKKFFREEAILGSLSDHLRSEICLHNYKQLINSVPMFKELPKHVVGLILASLKLEVYLTNDIIMKYNSQNSCMYFISYGTVAVYKPNGQECQHLTDGMQFGANLLYNPDGEVFNYTCIAAEITECYRWDREDFLKCVNVHRGLITAIEKLRVNAVNALETAERELEFDKQADILTDLRRKKIIEVGRYRK